MMVTARTAIARVGRIGNPALRPQRFEVALNVEGTLDLAAAITLATVNDAAPHMGPAYWIPAFWVPALLVTHAVVVVLMGRRWSGPM